MRFLLSHLSVISDVIAGFNLLNPYHGVNLWRYFFYRRHFQLQSVFVKYVVHTVTGKANW